MENVVNAGVMGRKLIHYLPYQVREFKEYQGITTGEQPEFELAWSGWQEVFDNQYIDTAGDYGLSRWEKILDIRPGAEDSLETRRARIRAIWNRKPPYTLLWLKRWLAGICGSEGYPLGFELDLEDYQLRLRFRYDSEAKGKDRTIELIEDISELVPENMVLFPASVYAPIRFIWMPDVFLFRRFIVSSALPAHPLGICLPSILWGGIRFAHFQGSARFDGMEDFDGSINFDQTFGAIPFRKLIVHMPFYSSQEEGLSAALAVRFAFRRRFSVRFDGQTSFDGSVNFDQDLGYRLRFQRFLYGAAFRHREKSAVLFDGEGSFDGSMDFDQRYGAVGFPNIKFNIRNFVSERFSSGFLFRHTFHRRFSVRLDGSAGFDGELDFDQAYGNRVMFPRYQFNAVFVHGQYHRDSPPPVLRVSSGFRETKRPAVLASFAASGTASEQNRAAFFAFSVSGAKAPRHSGALAGQITMDNWQALDGSAKLDGTFKLDAYLRQEGI